MNNTMRNRIGDIEFEVRARLGIIENYPTGWAKELNIISWNGGVPKYDIRDWSPDHSQMSKGITLHETEAQRLRELLDARFTRPAVKGRGWDTAENAEAVEKERQEALASLQASQEAAQAEPSAVDEAFVDEEEREEECEQEEQTENEVA